MLVLGRRRNLQLVVECNTEDSTDVKGRQSDTALSAARWGRVNTQKLGLLPSSHAEAVYHAEALSSSSSVLDGLPVPASTTLFGANQPQRIK